MPAHKHYGILIQNKVTSHVEEICEQIKYDGYAVIPSILCPNMASNLRIKSLKLNEEQNKKYGMSILQKIGEVNQIRLPLVHDRRFLDMLNIKILKKVLTALFDLTQSYYILNQQNIIINTGDETHNQASWHRDFPYMSGISDTVHAYSALLTLDEFTKDNGGTQLVPGTHRHTQLPSWKYIEKQAQKIVCPVGSCILFDSNIFHSSGINTTNRKRIAINNIFTNPAYRQQIPIPDAIYRDANYVPINKDDLRMLGFENGNIKSDFDFKESRRKKNNV